MATEEEVIFKIDIAPESITSIENLTKANKALREERKKLNLETEEGRKRAADINKQLDANTEIIKENSSALEKQRLNIGNYTGALDKLVPGLGATASGFGAMTKSALAFIATPIGAVIGALGLAIAAVTQYFRDNEEGQNKFNQIMNVTGAIIGKVTDAVSALGGFLIDKLFKGFEFLGDVLSKVIPGFDTLIAKTREYLNLDRADFISQLQAETDELERQLIVDRGRIQAKIAEAKLISENKDLSPEQRAKGLRDAIDAQKELSALELRFAQNKLTLIQEENKQSNSNKDALKAEAEAQAELDRVRKDGSDKLKEITTKEQQLRAEGIKLLEAERDAIIARNNEELIREANETIARASREEEHQRELERVNERIQAFRAENEVLAERIANLDLEGDLTDEATDANYQYTQEKIRSAKASQMQAKAEADAATNVQAASNLAVQVAGKNKGIASGATLINTYLAAQKAYASQIVPGDPSSIIRAFVAAALATASGLARVAAINGVGFFNGGLIEGFAGGGISGQRIMGHHGRPIRRSNGDDRLVTVKTGEVVLNQRQQSALGGPRTFRNIGVPGFASGGVTGTVSMAAQRSEVQNLNRDLFQAIGQMQFYVAVTDINEGQSRVSVIEEKAQIL